MSKVRTGSACGLALVLLCGITCLDAATPLDVRQTRYEIRSGETAHIDVSSETLDFLLKATSLRADLNGAQAGPLAIGPNHARDGILLAAPHRVKPGEYTATVTATSAAGEQRVTTLAIVVKPRQTVPSSGFSRPPVVLLNGWETGITGTCTISSNSSDTFGNLAEYLIADGVPVVYFFDNCVEDPNDTIEGIGNYLGTYLNTITYDNGDQVPQIDLVAFSMGGLIARSYLAGLQPDETATPPNPTLVRDLILIATPNFGSFVAGNYINSLAEGTQSAELVPASSFLWNLATWNQRGDDLRGVNTLAVVGNAGFYLASLESGTELTSASDGLVTLTSGAAGFALPASPPTQVVPYCHVDPSAYTNTLFGTYECNAPGIANVDSETQETGKIVRSFLAGTGTWQSVGTPAADNGVLNTDGGIYFAMQDENADYLTDLTSVAWGSVPLTTGGDLDTVYYTDFVNGSGEYQAISTSLGSNAINCGTLTEPAGYFTAARCKIDAAIFSVGPRTCGSGRTISSGGTINITGNDFGTTQCNGCQVVATPISTGTETTLQVSSWTSTAISAILPSSISGLVTIQVTAVNGIDAITIMTAAPGTITSVSNAASFQPGVAPATWLAICGANLTTSTATWGASDFVNGTLPTSLDSVSVTIDGIPAYVEYVSPGQINVLAPDDTATGTVQVQVTANGQASNSVPVQEQPFAPAFFTFDSGKYVAAEHSDYSFVGATTLFAGATPATIGETVLLYGTGFGPTNPVSPTGNQVTAAEPLANTVTVTIGGVAASVVFAGLSGSGLNQLNVTIPGGLASGDAAVVATVGGVETQAGVYITIQ